MYLFGKDAGWLKDPYSKCYYFSLMISLSLSLSLAAAGLLLVDLSTELALPLSPSELCVTQLKILQAAPCVLTAELQLSQESRCQQYQGRTKRRNKVILRLSTHVIYISVFPPHLGCFASVPSFPFLMLASSDFLKLPHSHTSSLTLWGWHLTLLEQAPLKAEQTLCHFPLSYFFFKANPFQLLEKRQITSQ